jgi:hypothetical protein
MVGQIGRNFYMPFLSNKTASVPESDKLWIYHKLFL